MSVKKKFTSVMLSTILGFALLAPYAGAQTVAELQAQISALLAKLQVLQTQLDDVAPSAPTTSTTIPATGESTFNFVRDLTLGSKGDDALALQKFLNAQGFTLAASGPGSPGNETDFFGSLTQSALAKYQASVNISPAVGYFGPITRSHINSNNDPVLDGLVRPITEDSILISKDGGASFFPQFRIEPTGHIGHADVLSITFHPNTPGHVVVSSAENGLFKKVKERVHHHL